jgi:hypothetical protein
MAAHRLVSQCDVGHKSYLTTQRYINMASQLDEAVETLHVPDALQGKQSA